MGVVSDSNPARIRLAASSFVKEIFIRFRVLQIRKDAGRRLTTLEVNTESDFVNVLPKFLALFRREVPRRISILAVGIAFLLSQVNALRLSLCRPWFWGADVRI